MARCKMTQKQHKSHSVKQETNPLYADALEAYKEAESRGEQKHKLAAIAAHTVGLPTRKVRYWAKKYKWKE